MNSLRSPHCDPLQTDDGQQLYRCADVTENICVCHSPSADGGEFAVVESLPLKTGEIRQVLASGRDAIGVLKSFIADQREVLRLWAADALAQIREYVAQRHPGHELRNVAEAIGARFTCISRTTDSETTEKRGRGIRS